MDAEREVLSPTLSLTVRSDLLYVRPFLTQVVVFDTEA